MFPVEFFEFRQWAWIFVKGGGTKDRLVENVPSRLLLLPWLVSEKKIVIRNFGHCRSPGNFRVTLKVNMMNHVIPYISMRTISIFISIFVLHKNPAFDSVSCFLK